MTETPPHRRRRVLLLDDDPGDRALAVRLLEGELDVDVVPVADGVAFAAQLTRGEFDAAVCELRISWGDMADALDVVRHHRPDVPVVLFTSGSDPGALGRLVGSRIDALVPKDSGGYLRLGQTLSDLLDENAGKTGSGTRRRSPGEAPASTGESSRDSDRFREIVHSLSHDLQEPLQLVTRYTKLLEEVESERDEDWKGRRYAEHIVGGTRRMQAMIDGMLEYARLDSWSEPPRIVPLSEAVETALANLRGVIEESGAEVTLEALPSVPGDLQQLVALFQNLIANAIKFRGDRPPRVHVGREEEEDTWVVFVRDDGIGIPLEDRERIFGLFRRLHPEDRYPGSGMGLAICRRIVERHGGDIWVVSSPGEGSTFKVRLPRERRSRSAGQPKEEAGGVRD